MVEGLSPWFDERGERGLRQAQLIGQLSGLDFADSPTVKGLDPRSLRDRAFAVLRGYLQALAAKGALRPGVRQRESARATARGRRALPEQSARPTQACRSHSVLAPAATFAAQARRARWHQ